MTVESDASSFNDIVEFNSTDHNADSRVENRRSIRSSTSGSSNLISKDDEKHPSFAKIFISTRFFIAILVLGGVFCQYSAKLDLSVNIVCMVNSSAHGSTNITSTSDCERPNNSQTDGPFIYTEKQRATLLAAFFYGYLITEIPGGILAGKFGSMIPMAAGTALNSLSAWHYVSAAKHSYGLFVFTRVLVGCGSGVILPCASNVWTKWAPVSEKSFLIAIATSGAHIAPIFILPLGGYLCKASGWEAIFYVTASIELLWILLWLIFFRDTPQKSWITPQREKDYILKHLDTVRVETNELSAPWKAILTSKHCWGLFLTHTCANWGFYTLLTETPSYFSNVLYLDTSKSGFVSAIPYVIIWFTTTLSSFLADYLFRKNIIKNRTVIRKIAVMMGTWIPGIFLIALGFVKCSQQNLAILLLALGQGLFGITWGAGHMCNANDIVPVHAGVVFGISNTFATLPGILTPYVTAVLTPQNTQKQWQIVFSLSAAIMMMGGVIFLFLGSGNPEIWDSDDNVPPHRGSITRMM